MLARQPFARRIVIAFTLMTLVVSGVFSLGIVAVVHFIEEQLVSQELGSELDTALNDVLVLGTAPRLDAVTRFFGSDLPGYEIPEAFRGVSPGFTEVVSQNEAYYVYLRQIESEQYMLVEEQQEFEARETALFGVVLAGFLLSIVGAWGLGRLMADKVMAPVSRLAQQVRLPPRARPAPRPRCSARQCR